jgi:putative thioredoxin
MAIKDSTEAGFETDVIAASHSRGVVVDFWAPWCGPCHQLTPILERVAERYADDVDLVKLNVDDAPQLAARYRVQGIPAVKAFKGGKPVAEFTGVQPEPAVERLFAAVAPSEADRLVAQALDAAGAERERLLRAALAVAPAHTEARRLLTEVELMAASATDGELAELRAAADAGEANAKVQLGRALLAAGLHEEALTHLLDAVAEPDAREDARTALLDAFAVLGDDHPLVRAYRPKLAAALF